MAFERGFSRIKKAKEEADQRRQQMAAIRTPEVYLKEDGEEVELWFNGPSDEPVQALYHSVKVSGPRGERFSFELCGKRAEGHAGCVYCAVSANGDRRVKKAQTFFVWNVVDTRFVHKAKNDEKTAKSGGQFDRFDWYNCTGGEDGDPAECKYCKKKVPRDHRGASRLRLSVTVAGSLDGRNDALTKKCVGCGGKIKFDGYRNGKRVLMDIEDVSNPEDWTPEYRCMKCSDPIPGNIRLCPVTMSRSGVDKMTSYNFSTGPFEDPPEWVQQIPAIDLDVALAPRSAEQMAEHLGIDNPFDSGSGKKNGKKAASSYDDDEEEVTPATTSSDPFEDD